MKRNLIVMTLLGAVMAGAIAPSMAGTASAASRANSHPAFLDKTRFVIHAGLAFGAFHHWVWKPYRAGSFTKGAPHRTKDMIKGGVALLFTLHEIKVARDIAHKSNSGTLKTVVKPLDAIVASFQKVGNQLKKGVLSVTDLTGLNKLVDGVSGKVGVSDKSLPIPGT